MSSPKENSKRKRASLSVKDGSAKDMDKMTDDFDQLNVKKTGRPKEKEATPKTVSGEEKVEEKVKKEDNDDESSSVEEDEDDENQTDQTGQKEDREDDLLKITTHPSELHDGRSCHYYWLDKIELQCVSNKQDAAKYQWSINGKVEKSLRGSSISFNLNDIKYIGKYRCVVEWNGERLESKSTKVVLEEPTPSLMSANKNHHNSYVKRFISSDSFAPLFVREFAEFHQTKRKNETLARRFLEEDFSVGPEKNIQEILGEAFRAKMPQFNVTSLSQIPKWTNEEATVVAKKAVADIMFKAKNETGRLLGVSEIKRRPMNGDPSIQAVRYFHLHALHGSGIAPPCFLLVFVGERFDIYGATFVSASNDCVPLNVRDPDIKIAYELLDSVVLSLLRIDYLASMLGKLEHGMETLAKPRDVSLFPWIKEYGPYGDHVKFEYVRRMKGTMVFEAKEEKSGEHVVVKFVQGVYGKEAHKHFHEKGFAPALKYSERVPAFGAENVLTQVVMEFIPNVVSLSEELKLKRPSVSVPSLRRSLEKLRDIIKDDEFPFVHGDLRPVNIIVDRLNSAVFVVDFDWARRKGKGFYSPRVDSKAGWFAKAGLHAQKNKEIKKKHDIDMLEAVLKELEK
ncbi:uncharacterized protein [Oscarella lobularis]|uniref:uncharacterized protein isoform X2 n=1 Tax=Oscarella lobularis TaxID=121494 RepID=UPI003313203B